MKRIAISLFVFVLLHSVEASSCFDVSSDILPGTESSVVLGLQNFLVEKGHLKASPNGYYGQGTVSAVKLYQRSLRIPPTGAVHSLTRKAIKKNQCTQVPTTTVATTTKATTTTPVKATTTTTVATTTIKTTAVATTTKPIVATTSIATTTLPVGPRPAIIQVQSETFIAGATSTASFIIIGSGFSTTTNEVFIKSRNIQRTYSMGKFPATDKNSKITIVSSMLTGKQLPCGDGCLEFLSPGTYDVTVKTDGGESGTGYVVLKGFTSRSETALNDVAFYYGEKKKKIGTITLSTSVPIYLSSMAFTATYDPKPTKGGVSNYYLRDEMKGADIGLSLGGEFLPENSSKIYTVYADADAVTSSLVSINPVVTVRDSANKASISIKVPSFKVSVSPLAY